VEKNDFKLHKRQTLHACHTTSCSNGTVYKFNLKGNFSGTFI